MIKRKSVRFTFSNITPDEIFLDSQNIPDFDKHQFEGRVEKALKPGLLWIISLVFLFFGGALLFQTAHLQIKDGKIFATYAENNHLKTIAVNPERGLIYDRNNQLLAWNAPVFLLVDGKNEVLETYEDWEEINRVYKEKSGLGLKIESASSRNYISLLGMAHAVGYVSCLTTESDIGKEGVEKIYEKELSGVLGKKLVETDSSGQVKSEFMQKQPSPGQNIVLSVDSRVQNKFYEILAGLSKEKGFTGGAGVIMDVQSGEVLSLVSYPEYNLAVLAKGRPAGEINAFLSDSRKPFLNRAVSGLYAPGSIVKPIVALAALNEKIIDPKKQILASGSISIPNPYLPGKESVFLDWKVHGLVDMERALAVSSDVYFYTIGGGYGDVSGLGVSRLKKYFTIFGLGKKTGIDLPSEKEGVVPDAESKAVYLPSDPVWRIGDTYHMSIGQGNVQVTPIQMAVAAVAIANNGRILKPEILLGAGGGGTVSRIEVPNEYFKIIKKGMRRAVLEGTAQGLADLSVNIAAKTGTAELGSGKFVNSWMIGFWPYENPRYAITIVLEKGASSNLTGGVFAARSLFDWMSIHTPEYLQ